MARRWVINASPLIALSRIEKLALLDVLADDIVVPAAVAREIASPADVTALTGAVAALRKARTEIVPSIDAEVARWDLGAGETDVLSWARQQPGFEAIVDDRAARSCAAAIGVPVRGTLGILVLAKQEGHLATIRSVVEALRERGMYLDHDLVDTVLALAGE